MDLTDSKVDFSMRPLVLDGKVFSEIVVNAHNPEPKRMQRNAVHIATESDLDQPEMIDAILQEVELFIQVGAFVPFSNTVERGTISLVC